MKDSVLSLIRFISMLLIIACHIFQYYGLELAFWLNVGVQIFLFLSGYLYGKKDINDTKNFLKKQYIKIIVPYILLSAIILVFEYINNPLYFSANSKVYLIGRLIGFQEWIKPFPNIYHTWFISVILLCYLITPILNRIKKELNILSFLKYMIISLIFIQLLVGFGILNVNPSYLILYLFGYFIANVNEKEHKKIAVLVVLLTLIILPVRLKLEYSNFKSFENILTYLTIRPTYFISYHHALCGMSIFMLIKTIFKRIKYNKIFEFSDKYSYYIYLVHQIFILGSYSLLNLSKSIFLNILIVLITIIVSAILLHLFTDFTKKIFKPIKARLLNIKEVKL